MREVRTSMRGARTAMREARTAMREARTLLVEARTMILACDFKRSALLAKRYRSRLPSSSEQENANQDTQVPGRS